MIGSCLDFRTSGRLVQTCQPMSSVLEPVCIPTLVEKLTLLAKRFKTELLSMEADAKDADQMGIEDEYIDEVQTTKRRLCFHQKCRKFSSDPHHVDLVSTQEALFYIDILHGVFSQPFFCLNATAEAVLEGCKNSRRRDGVPEPVRSRKRTLADESSSSSECEDVVESDGEWHSDSEDSHTPFYADHVWSRLNFELLRK